MIKILIDAALYVVITVSAVTDIKESRVPNSVTYPAIAVGLGLNALLGGLDGFFNGLAGFGLGFVMMFLLFLWGGFGGGDVKLMAAVGALKGFPFVVVAAFYAAIVGGIYSLIVIIWQGRFRRTLFNIGHQLFAFIRPSSAFAVPLDKKESTAIPFGFCICLGTLWAQLEGVFHRSLLGLF